MRFKLFRDAGATVTVMNDRPNGVNINQNCGSQHTQDLAAMVLEKQADLGIAFDGDGDRCIAVDENGNELRGDQLLAICALGYSVGMNYRIIHWWLRL